MLLLFLVGAVVGRRLSRGARRLAASSFLCPRAVVAGSAGMAGPRRDSWGRAEDVGVPRKLAEGEEKATRAADGGSRGRLG